MLGATPGLTAMTLLEEIQRRHAGKYDDSLLRTLQRRVRTWNASYGKEREVFYFITVGVVWGNPPHAA